MNSRRAGAVFILAVLALSMMVVTPARATSTERLKPTDSAYVVADLNDNGTDKLGLKSLNTGNLNITKVWYAWNLTIINRTSGKVAGYVPVKIVSLAYMKFDLSGLHPGDITNATLNLYSINSNMTGASRFLVAYQVDNNGWSQSTLDFYNAPNFNRNVNSSASVTNGVKGWYKFDLTKMAQGKAGGQLSIMITFLILYQHNEEQVVFDSPRATSNQPYLLVAGNVPTGAFSSLGGFFTAPLSASFPVPPGILLIIVIVVAGVAYYFYRKRKPSIPKPEKVKEPKPKEKQKPPPSTAAAPTAPQALALGAKCPNCGEKVESDFKLCPKCGQELTEKVCGSCGRTMKMEFKVCPYCGNNAS